MQSTKRESHKLVDKMAKLTALACSIISGHNFCLPSSTHRSLLFLRCG